MSPSQNDIRHALPLRAPCWCAGVILLLVLAGCRQTSPAGCAALGTAVFPAPVIGDAISVPAAAGWVDTGIALQAGESVTIEASGQVAVQTVESAAEFESRAVGPAGTYLYSDEAAYESFPLPAAAGGPAPAYALIGRIGDGPAFYVGERMDRQAGRDGRLMLRVNDFCPADNSGSLEARVQVNRPVEPLRLEQVVPFLGAPGGWPAADCSIVVFYMDGLRPDIIREMAAMGHIPHINALFVEGGAWMSNCFTAFPSDTITSNGTMWTGCFSDRHGIKGQVRFSRRTLQSESYLEPLGPNRSARLLAPQGIDKAIHNARAASISVLKGREAGQRWRQREVSGVPPIYQHLRNNGGDWATGVLPMMTDVPPLLWTRSLVRSMPYLHAQDGGEHIDDANAHYATRHLLNQRQPVTIIWLPETDSVSHKMSRGQFGITRRTIARADRLIGRVVRELQAQCRLDNTYLMLVSDHGHHGGRESHLSHFDIANELFHKPREVAADGTWIGGGLGMSVRQHRFWNRHPEHGSRDFVFIDGQLDGVVRVFLPRGHFQSADWMGPFRPADMLEYKIACDQPPVNLIDAILQIKAVSGRGVVEHPVDLVLTKVGENAILVSTVDRGHALIDRRRNESGRWEYKYTPVENLRPVADGSIAYDPVALPKTDPLELVGHLPLEMLAHYHDERSWLRFTTDTRYPDSVVALTRHMLWQENLRFRETEYSSDLVITARPGWYFGHKSSPGTMHGYPLSDAMRATLFISGPNIRRGARIVEPCRLADLTPTMLAMTGTPSNPDEFDGRALRSIYATPAIDDTAVVRPLYWSDVNLHAWQPLDYQPLEPYEHLPLTVNRPESAFDLNNIVYNALSVTNINALRLLGDLFGRRDWHLLTRVENFDHRLRNRTHPWIGEAVEVLDVPGTTLGDYSTTSLGNLKRIDRAVDWTQHRLQEFDGALAASVGRQRLPGSRPLHKTIDATQWGMWEVYRFAQRIVVQAVDETLINSVENGADRAINRFRRTPAEIVVERPPPVREANREQPDGSRPQ